jgi:hypothetical protein
LEKVPNSWEQEPDYFPILLLIKSYSSIHESFEILQ